MPSSEYQEISARVRELEKWRTTQDTQAALAQKDREHLDERFDRLEKQIAETRSMWLRIAWVLGLAVIGAFAQFVINGGLVV
jgi:predicted nuclease with TOPRIM domain